MINNHINVSLYKGNPPRDEESDRKIADGPLYAKTTIASIAASGKVRPWASLAIDDVMKWSLEDKLCSLIEEAMAKGRYIDSEWCICKPRGPWAACDAYLVQSKEWIPAMHKETTTTYYLKFAIGKTGQILLTASNHPEHT